MWQKNSAKYMHSACVAIAGCNMQRCQLKWKHGAHKTWRLLLCT